MKRRFQKCARGGTICTVLLALLAMDSPLRAEGPASAGLQLWLDASDSTTLICDAGGRLTAWRDKSGRGNDAVNKAAGSGPRVVAGGMAGRDVLRFDGKPHGLEILGGIREKPGSLTLFVVSQRLAAQASGPAWQRLFSSNDGTATADNRVPNVCMMATADGNTKAYRPRIDDREFTDVVIRKIGVGRAATKAPQFFAGDIAEILVYDRVFLSEDESRAILAYLHAKWNAHIAREDRGWTRAGALDDPPKHITAAYPLSDQENRGRWIKNELLSDEFEETDLDTTKWRPEYPGWKGRQPARFCPHNVTVSDGKLKLTMRKEAIPKELESPGYKDYTSAAVDSLSRAHYGYYEVMAKPMNSAGSSSFWFSRTDMAKHGTEIDVFEIGGKALGFERKLNMNLHVWETPQEKRHWSIGSAWIAPWRLADDYHVYGFQWDVEEIKYFVDGVVVRRIKNTDWHDPLHMQFDSETMPTWFGMPKDEDLPSTYSIEYVRAWRHEEDSDQATNAGSRKDAATPILVERTRALCREYTEGFVHPSTELAYGQRINGPRGIAALESVEAVAERTVHGEHRPWGYGSGIEDLAYQNGMLLYALCDAEEATNEPLFAEMARRAYRGLRRMSTISPVAGFVPRGPHPADGKSYYPDSSLDQHSLYVCGLWRYHNSRLASADEKQWIAETIVTVLRRFEKNRWSFLVEDNSAPSHAGGDMLPMRPTQAALLLAMLAVTHQVSGDDHWLDLYHRFGNEQGGTRWKLLAEDDDPRRPPRYNNFTNQDMLRTETLRRIETDLERKAVLRRRIARTAEGMLKSSYFEQWTRMWLMSETWAPGSSDEVANAYLKPLGLTLESEVTVMDMWKRFDQNLQSPELLPGQRNHYEPITLAVPAMVWQVALLSQDPPLVNQVRPAIEEMFHRVDFGRIDLGWAYNYAVLAALWNLAAP